MTEPPRDRRELMPRSAPEPHLRGPLGKRYLDDRYEREYASLAEQLEALAHDIEHARVSARGRVARGGAGDPPPPRGELVTLPDGGRIVVRPIEPGDARALRAGFDRLDAVSRYQRFLTPIDHLSPEQLDYLTDVDHVSHEALVAFDAAGGEGVGVGRFVRDTDRSPAADAAIVVIGPWQGRGVGTVLAQRLAARARSVGVTAFTTRTLAGNVAARRVLERVGTPVREVADGGTVVLTTELRHR